jgi:hypothetical protein
MRKLPVLALIAAMAAGGAQAQLWSTWRTIANNADPMPGSTLTFSSFNQPSVNSNGLVVFRARSKGSDASGERVNSAEISATPSTWSVTELSAKSDGGPVHGIYTRDMGGIFASLIVEITARGKTVPPPNNALTNGELATFEEYPSTPRIDTLSPTIATRGQSRPVYEYQIGIDPATGLPLTTKIGTSGIYTNLSGALITGASLLGAVTDFPAGTVTFPYYSVPGAPAGTRFDQFPGSPAVANGTIIAFKGNYTDPSDGLGKTGVYYRDVAASAGKSPVQLVANTATVIPNPPGAPVVTFGSTAPPSAANGYMVFTGLDIEAAPTRGGIYRAPLQPSPALQTLAGIGDQVPGEAPGVGFTAFGEGLSISSEGRFVSFWGAWGTETFTKVLNCPVDGNAEIVAYCAANYPSGYLATIPVHQGIFVVDAQSGKIYPVAKTLADGYVDFLYWVFSGRPPGTGGGDEPSLEPPRWRSSAFTALYGVPGSEVQTAFKAARTGYDGIYVRQGRGLTRTLLTMVETLNTMGTSVDPMAPANSVVTAIGIERDGFRNGNLTAAVSMLFADPVTPLGWAGIYVRKVAPVPIIPDPPEPVASTTTLASSLNPATFGIAVNFTATVTGKNPTGTVNFTDGGTSIVGCSAVAFASGSGGTRTASCSTSNLAVGVHSIVASYSGDANNLTSASAPLSQVINASSPLPSTTTLVSSLNPSTVGASVTFTATVSDSSPTGTVAFMDGAAGIAGCSAQPVDAARQAKCTTSGLTQGTHSITAQYSGDSTSLPSVSAALSQVVNAIPLPATTITLTSSANPSKAGTAVTFTASITGNAPTGRVSFYREGSPTYMCTAVALTGSGNTRTATCTTTYLLTGTFKIVATYGGDTNNAAATSAPYAQTVVR